MKVICFHLKYHCQWKSNDKHGEKRATKAAIYNIQQLAQVKNKAHYSFPDQELIFKVVFQQRLQWLSTFFIPIIKDKEDIKCIQWKIHEWTQKWRQLLQWTHCVNLAVVRLSASRCIWANRRPGKVRNAPIREQSRARISLKVSLDMGPLWKRKHIVRFYCSFVSHKEFMKAGKTKMIL